jgi:phosphatidylglycerophosphate synthase
MLDYITDIDNQIGNRIVSHKIFSHVHPNYVTLFSGVLNYFIFQTAFENNPNKMTVLLIVRCITDIIDGNIARRYDKKSATGASLDSIMDIMLFMIYAYVITSKLTGNKDNTIRMTIAVGLFLTYFMLDTSMFTDHDIIKRDGDNIINRIISKLETMTVFIFGGVIYLNYKYGILNLSN